MIHACAFSRGDVLAEQHPLMEGRSGLARSDQWLVVEHSSFVARRQEIQDPGSSAQGEKAILVTFSAIHTDGDGEDNIRLGSLERLFDELKAADPEHGDVSVVDDDTGWAISAHRDGRLVLEHLGDDPAGAARHRFPVQKADVLQIWARFMGGELEKLLGGAVEAWVLLSANRMRKPKKPCGGSVREGTWY